MPLLISDIIIRLHDPDLFVFKPSTLILMKMTSTSCCDRHHLTHSGDETPTLKHSLHCPSHWSCSRSGRVVWRNTSRHIMAKRSLKTSKIVLFSFCCSHVATELIICVWNYTYVMGCLKILLLFRCSNYIASLAPSSKHHKNLLRKQHYFLLLKEREINISLAKFNLIFLYSCRTAQ